MRWSRGWGLDDLGLETLANLRNVATDRLLVTTGEGLADGARWALPRRRGRVVFREEEVPLAAGPKPREKKGGRGLDFGETKSVWREKRINENLPRRSADAATASLTPANRHVPQMLDSIHQEDRVACS